MTSLFRPLPCLVIFTAILSAGPGFCVLGEPAVFSSSAPLPGSPVIGPMLFNHGPLLGQKIRASAIRVQMIQSDQITLPAEFRVALYENLIQRLEKKDSFLRIYRDGDHHAAKIPDLVVLRSTVDGFTEASQKKRQVMTGAASITVHCRFTDNQGNVLLERDINSKVRFFGANRKATDDFAKKAASAVHDYFSAAGHT